MPFLEITGPIVIIFYWEIVNDDLIIRFKKNYD